LPPNVFANEVSSNIMVKDGHTVLIGGLFSEDSNVAKAQVPLLGNLPFAGPLFGQQSDTTDRREIIFLLTPHIIKDDDAFDDLASSEMKDVDRLRVGVRRGMMPWGRERLAETSYECAENELHKPNPDLNLVRWHLDCATNLNPQFLEAIKLKESLTGQFLSLSDNSSIRSFVRREMLAEAQETPSEPAPKYLKIAPEDKPATQPSVDATPAAQPAVAEAPTTQPSVAEVPVAPAAPTTQPSVAEAPVAPTTQPSLAQAPTPTTQPSIAQAPATQPGTDAAADLRDEDDK
jgi:hypothetical protein